MFVCLFVLKQRGVETYLEGRIIGLFKWRLDHKFALILSVDCRAQMRLYQIWNVRSMRCARIETRTPDSSKKSKVANSKQYYKMMCVKISVN